MTNIFGVCHTNIGKMIDICERVLGRDKVQLLTASDNTANRRCYIVVGVGSLNRVKAAALNRCNATLVVIDALPELLRIQGMQVLDVEEQSTWNPCKLRLRLLRESLEAPPQPLKVVVGPDNTLSNLILEVKSRGILDTVLAAAKNMHPSERTTLHMNVARYIAGEINLKVLRRRSEMHSTGKKYEAMMEALVSGTALRLREAVGAVKQGAELKEAAAIHNVDPSEIRFVMSHLEDKSGE